MDLPIREDVLVGIRRRIQTSGGEPPDPSFRAITWNSEGKVWRVQTPGPTRGQDYFSARDFGGVEFALIEAQYFRDDTFRSLNVGLYDRVKITKARIAKGIDIPMTEDVDSRNGAVRVVGYWQDSSTGVTKQRKVSRTIGKRTREQARAEIEAIVRLKIQAEAERCKRQDRA